MCIHRTRWRLGQQLAVLGGDGQADFLEGKNEQVGIEQLAATPEAACLLAFI